MITTTERLAAQVAMHAARCSDFGGGVARKYVGDLCRVPLIGPVQPLRHQQQSYQSSTGGRSNMGYFLKSEKEASLYRDLGKRDPEAAIRAYEQGHVAQTESNLAEYIRALVKVDRLDYSRLLQHLQVRRTVIKEEEHSAHAPGTTAGGLSTIGSLAGPGTLGSLNNPVYTAQAEPSLKAQVWRTIRTFGTVFVVLSGVGVLLDQTGSSGGGVARGLIGGNTPTPQPTTETNTTFADVKGVDEAKAELEEIVHYLRNPEKYTSLGGKLPKGVMLVGPPGTGKTMLARAIAGEAGVPFFYSSGSDFEEMFVGVGARRVRDLFSSAKKQAPCIIFIDEIDAIGGSRNPKDQMYMRMTLNQILVELDGFKANEGVIVVAATNFYESLDKALVRPGRFDRTVLVPNPDVDGRRQILEGHFKGVRRAPNVDLEVIARGTPGMSGADLANLINIAALKAARDDLQAVGMECLEWAKDRILMGSERKSAVVSEDNRKLTAYHEGGHALVALHTDGALPVHKATIVPRGTALGMVMQLPEKDQESVSRRQLLARLDVAMGGRVAEEMIFGENEVTTGASADLKYATALAREMVTKYGFGENSGLLAQNYEVEGMSSEARQKVEDETKVMLTQAYERARKILTANRDELELVAKSLLEKETLTGIQIKQLLQDHKATCKSTRIESS